jgi:hypothetical protein
MKICWILNPVLEAAARRESARAGLQGRGATKLADVCLNETNPSVVI